MIIQPSFEEVGAPALLPLLVALNFALFMLVTRTVAKKVDPLSLQCVSGGVGTIVLGIAYIGLQPLELPSAQLVVPDVSTGYLLLALGVIGTIAHLLMTWSLRFAIRLPASSARCGSVNAKRSTGDWQTPRGWQGPRRKSQLHFGRPSNCCNGGCGR